MKPLYNREGRAVAYIADDEVSIYLYDGSPVAWLYQGCVFAYGGRFLGWQMHGWLYDPAGGAAFFTDRAQGGPRRPRRLERPGRSARRPRPTRKTRQPRPPRPRAGSQWSPASDESYFET